MRPINSSKQGDDVANTSTAALRTIATLGAASRRDAMIDKGFRRELSRVVGELDDRRRRVVPRA